MNYFKMTIMKNCIKKTHLLLIFFVSACSISPGMHLNDNQTWLTGERSVYIDSLDADIPVIPIEDYGNKDGSKVNKDYKLGVGDQLSYYVWGLPELFPPVYTGPDQNLRRVDSNGNIFFPFAGEIVAEGKTINELRVDVTEKLSSYFNDPQLDLNIARFNSKYIYVLGEVSKPKKMVITDTPLSLSDALGDALGVDRNTSDSSEVFIIRNNVQETPLIYIADLTSPAGFLSSNNFYLNDRDIVFVNAKGTARWNRVISQFFPFSSFLNSVDNLVSD